MAISQLGTIKSQFAASVISLTETTGGNLSAGITGFIFVSGENRARGRNILSSSLAFTIASNNARLQVQVQTNIITSTGEDIRRVLISYSATNDPATAQQIAVLEMFALDQVTPTTLPANIVFSEPDQLTPLVVTNDSQLPTIPLNGMIVEITDDAKYYEYDEDATEGTYSSPPGFWVESDFDGFTNITSTTQAGGCDVTLRSIGSSFIAPPVKESNADSVPVKYLYLNGRSEGSGSVLQQGTVINALITSNGENVTDAINSKGFVIYRLLGYYRYLDATLDTSQAQSERPIFTSSPITLPQDLQPGYGALFEIFYRFTSSEISSIIPSGNALAFYFDDGILRGVPSSTASLTGDTVWNVGEKLRLFPGVRGSGQATIDNLDTPFVPQQGYTGLLADTADQYAAMSGAIAGDVRVRQNQNDILDSEVQRAIISTVPGDGPPTSASNQVVLGANGALQVTVTNDNNGLDRFNIRDDYPDVIGGVENIATLPPLLKLFVDDGTNLYEYNQIVTVGFNSTTVVNISDLSGSSIAPLPSPASDFFLYKPVGAPIIADAGSGSLAAGTYTVYAAYTSNPSPNFLPTVIDHSTANGNIPESTKTLLELSNDLAEAIDMKTTAQFTQPAVDANIIVPISSVSLLVVGGFAQIEVGGSYEVIAINGLDVTLRNTGSVNNAPPTTIVPTNSKVSISGSKGDNGIDTGLSYDFDSDTTIADPGVGNIRFDNAAYTSVTQVALSSQTSASGNPDISGYINTWDDSTNTSKGYLQVTSRLSQQNFAILEITSITDNSGWFTVDVTHNSSNGTITGSVSISFFRTGDKGLDGANGADGADGADGESSGLRYIFNSSTNTSIDPGSGQATFNNATFSSVTEIAVSDNNNEAGNPDVSPYLLTWDDSTNSNKGYIQVKKEGSAENFAIFQLTSLTDEAGFIRYAVTHSSSNGTISNTDTVSVDFFRAGDQGDQGIQGSQGLQGNDGADGADGISAALSYEFSTSTDTSVDPTAGKVRFNNASFSLVTQISISGNNASPGNPSVVDYLTTWDDSTNGIKGFIQIRKSSAQENFILFQLNSLVDNTSWIQVTGVEIASNGTIALNDPLAVEFFRSGDKGDVGTVGSTSSLILTHTATPPTTAISESGLFVDSADDKLKFRDESDGNVREVTLLDSIELQEFIWLNSL